MADEGGWSSTDLRRVLRRATAGLAAALLAAAPLTACSGDSESGTGGGSSDAELTSPPVDVRPTVSLELAPADALAAATTYADLAFATYSDAVVGANEMRASIQSFVSTPSEATLAAARQSWVSARHQYGVTEVFRFYDGPIDHPETGQERRLNAWPVNPSYIDATAESPNGGIVHDEAGVPDITPEALVAAHGRGGEANVATGWHAIEFLLWGEDTNADGPGSRPATDYDTAPSAARRRAYLSAVTDLLLTDLVSVREQWHPENGGYRAQFLADPVAAVGRILEGMGTLSSGELAARRMAEPYESRTPETEYARFSDNTLNDIVANTNGIRLAYTGAHPAVQGESLSAVVARLDAGVDEDLRKQLDNNVAAADALPGPFDQVVLAGDDDPDRAEIRELIEDLHAQGQSIAALAAAFGLEISLEP